MVKLLATDMDGTFLDKAGTYDKQRLAKLLEQCKDKGIYFVVASGRCLLSIKELFADFQDDIIFLAENGGVVEYKGQVIHEELMPRETYLEIVDKIQNSSLHATDTVHLSGKEATYVYADISPAYRSFLEHYSPRFLPVEDFGTVRDQIFKVGASFPNEGLHQAIQWINENLSGVASMTSGYDCLDVMMEHVNKGVALEKLCHHLGIALADVVAFGDNLNDAQMLTVAGQAVVPENAQPAIKELTNQIIGPHEAGSVITHMEEIVCQSN